MYVLSKRTLYRETVLSFLFPKEVIDVRPNESMNKKNLSQLQTLDTVCVRVCSTLFSHPL